MADRKHLLHVKSNVVETAEQYGIQDFLVTPKKPNAEDMLFGEIAVNYGKGGETLAIKNSNGEIITFVNENDFNEASEIISETFSYLENKKIDTSDAISKINLITYDEIKTLREQSKLKPGQFYRIIDYVTTTTQTNTQSAGHPFDIIVLATDVNTLNENAKAIKHEGDTYFANSDLDAWEIKYDLDNDTSKYAWADETNGKGVIFYMKDEWNNECPYDFKNVQFKRWAVTDVQDSNFDSTTLDDLKRIFVYDNDNSKFITRYACENSNLLYGSTTHVVNGNDSDWYYTFSTFKYDGIYALNEIEDASTKGNNFYNDKDGCGCFGNSIKPYYNNMVSNEEGINGAQYLNNIVFNGFYDTFEDGNALHCFANSIGYNSYNMTFGNNCYYNTFGNNCYYHTFGNNCWFNTFGNICYYNTFGEECTDNSFGNSCTSNTFGNSCYYNTFGNSCWDNTFAEFCTNNSFGNGSSRNTFGNTCHHNTFGEECTDNSFGNSCYDNIFVKSCYNNTFVTYCSYNTFGNSVGYVTLEKNYSNYIIVESGNRYITLTSSQETSVSQVLRNITIAQGVNNSTSESDLKVITHNTLNDTFKTTYQNVNSKTVDV